MPLGKEVGLSPGDIVFLDGDPACAHEKGHSIPHFSAHVYCDQMAGWMKMPWYGGSCLRPGDIVLDEELRSFKSDAWCPEADA